MIEDPKPEFKIVCEKCGSEKVNIDSDVGFSALSGAWGSIFLHCEDCGQQKDIWEPS